MKVLIIGGLSRSLINFRGPLIRAMIAKGHQVFACSGEAQKEVTETLAAWGVEFFPVHLSRAGMRPWEDLRTCWQLYLIMKKIKPDLVLAYTIKPVIWAGLAARMAGVPKIFSLITGLGYAFIPETSVKSRGVFFLASFLYRSSLLGSRKVFFQNPDDMQVFISMGLVKAGQCVRVHGSGVDLTHYAEVPLPEKHSFLMICRLLAAKGVREYVDAARIIRGRYPEVSFQLVGALDTNPSSVTWRELEGWKQEGIIEYLGRLKDVRPAIEKNSVYVLPSYREGTPRTILEAMSMGRPIITTDAPGCRETVVQGENGFLVPVKSVDALVKAMEFFILNPESVEKMGVCSRKLAKNLYDVHGVNKKMLKEMGL